MNHDDPCTTCTTAAARGATINLIETWDGNLIRHHITEPEPEDR